MNLEAYKDYFKSLAEKHVDIQHTEEESHFSMIQVNDLENTVHTSLKFPAIGLELPVFHSGGNGYANIRWEPKGALMVFVKNSDFGSQDSNTLANQKAWNICDDISARMIHDRKQYDLQNLDYVIPGLDHDSFSIEIMPSPLHGYICGARLSWKMNYPKGVYNQVKWQE